jgi:hypothetical protein
MALENVHPQVLERVQKQLPAEAVIKVASASPRTTTFIVEYKGTERQVPMPKKDIDTYFGIFQRPEMTAGEGDKLADVIAAFSDKYGLCLLADVDYEVPEGVVAFDGAWELSYTLIVSEDSTSLFGDCTFTVKDKNRVPKVLEKVAVTLEEPTAALALAGKVIDGAGKVFTANQLTAAFSKKVVDLLVSLQVPGKFKATDFSTAVVLDDVDDGISRMVLVRILKGQQLAIRYTSTDKDRPAFKKKEA